MKRFALAVLLSSVSTLSVAGDTTCQQGKYDAYIDASLAWYQDLVTLTTEQNPQLADVSKWFLEGRTNHFELNREAECAKQPADSACPHGGLQERRGDLGRSTQESEALRV